MNITDIDIIVDEAKTEAKTEDHKDLVQYRVNEVMAAIDSLEIQDQDAMAAAAEWLRKNKETQKFVKEFFEEDRKRTYDAYQAVTKEIKRFTDLLTKSEKSIKRKMADYQIEQERIRREEEEKRRKEEEKRLQEEEKKRKAAEKKGKMAPLPSPPVVIEAPAQEEEKLEGVSFVEVWTYTIDDTSKIPREYMIPDEKKIRDVVKAMKGDANIPGVKIFADKQVRARA